MDSSRKRTYIIMLTTQTIAGIVNVLGAASSFWQGQRIGGGVSSLFAVACAVTSWLTVCREQQQLIDHSIREEVLREQKADALLKEMMIEHLTKMKENGGSVDIGLPIGIRRDH